MSDENQNLNNAPEDLGLDEIVGRGARVPQGRYTAKLINIEGKDSQSGKPMVEARFEVQSGDHEGEDILAFYSLSVTPPKKPGGKHFAPGLIEMKTVFDAVGEPLPASFRFPYKDSRACAKEFAKRVGKKLLDIMVIEEREKPKEGESEGQLRTRVRVLGVASGKSGGKSASKAAAAQAPVAAAEDEDDYL